MSFALSADLSKYRKLLAIDREQLEDCIADHPNLYLEVALERSEAISQRDACKLDVEELHAKLDKGIRAKAAEKDEKLTEASIQQRIKDDPSMQKSKTNHLASIKEADDWGAMVEAFTARGYALRELAAFELRRMNIEGDIVSTQRSAREVTARRGDAAIDKVREARANDPKIKPITKKKR